MERRSFFRLAAGTAAVAAFQDYATERVKAAAAAVAGRSAEEVAGDEDFWGEVRSAFTVDRNIINLNNGHVSPSPRIVHESFKQALDYSNQGPIHTMINLQEKQIEMVRKRLAAAAGCDPEELAITRNSSEALENAQYGI